MSDGGEGLVQTLIAAKGGKIIPHVVKGPMGRPVAAFIGVLNDKTTGIIEMAAASGLAHLSRAERNPLLTTTYGTGELIKHALDIGCQKIIIGIGGSATNDGGAGMAQALGAHLISVGEKEIQPGVSGLENLASIDISELDPRIRETEILIAADVDNPLCGPQGASYVYGKQKGAAPEMLPQMDNALRRYGLIVTRDLGIDIIKLPGAGAAGGLGGGLVAFLGGRIKKGIDLVIETNNLEEILSKGTDLVITGEGEINFQTAHGKVCHGVAKLAKKYNIPVIALAGSIGKGSETLYDIGIDAQFSIATKPMTLEESVDNTEILLVNAAEQCARLIKVLCNRQRT